MKNPILLKVKNFMVIVILILGRDFLNEYNILNVNQYAMLPNLAQDKLTPGKKATGAQ
jgi:hypothetical protein